MFAGSDRQSRHQDATLKIDLATGTIVWILGPHDAWKDAWQPLLLTPSGALEWAYHAYGTDITPQRTVLMFDNCYAPSFI